MIGNFAFADAGPDWLLHDACRITLIGWTRRGRRAKTQTDAN
jgi:hypothetical protein